jgi:hypothetical protein
VRYAFGARLRRELQSRIGRHMAGSVRKPESLSVFDDKTTPPTEAGLRRALGSAAAPWSELVSHIQDTYAPTVEQWHYAGARYGWSFRIGKPDRVILYLIPQDGRFLAGIVLGPKAVAAAASARLPARVLELIAAAPRYAEGTGVRIPVSKGSDLPSIRKLAALKMSS